MPANFAIDLRVGWRKPDPAGDSIRGMMVGVYVRDNLVDVLLPQPVRHELRRLARVTTALLRRCDDPRQVSGQLAILLADGGLHEADRLPVVASPHNLAEPALRPVGWLANDLLGIATAKLVKGGRLATDENVQ